MLRHEYADHVAALVFATMLRENEIRQRMDLGYVDNFVLAEEASRAGEALAAVRYPEAREVADTSGEHDARDLGDT